MHNIRRKAKYAAWYAEPGDSGYVRNPFRKYRSPSLNTKPATGPDAEERGQLDPNTLTQVQTDDYPAASEGRRRDFVGSERNQPSHAATAPNTHSKVDPRSETGEDLERTTSPVQEGLEREETIRPNEKNVVNDSRSSQTMSENPDATSLQGSEKLKHRPTAQHEHSHHEGLRVGKHEIHMPHRGHSNEIKPMREEDDTNGKEKKEKKEKQHFTPMSQVRATILNSWINVLLIFSPIGIALYYAKVNPIVVFVVNFIAIIPLAGMLSYATEEIAIRTGETIGGLLNASFGNAVELIVSVIALTQNQVLIVQTSLIGSMLSNLLLVMGMCFFFGGFNRVEQAFNVTVAQTASSLLFLAVSSLIIPTAFHAWSSAGDAGVAPLSRGTSVILLFVYACYLFFQLKSHAEMYNAKSEKNKKRDLSKHTKKYKGKWRKVARRKPKVEDTASQRSNEDDDKDEEEVPQLAIWTAIATLAASTVLVAFNAEYLVDSINAITCNGGISKNFVGLILLPIVGNAAEHATAVTVAVKDKMDLAIGVAVGSSMQIALLVLPFTVVLGWILGKDDMTLYFDGFQIAVLFVAVLLVNYLIQDGKSHWLEGILLQTLYIIIAVAAWFYPTKEGQGGCPA